jgi:hypothetical protein
MVETIYLVCAIVGGTLLVLQLLMGLLGLGHHDDVGGDHDLHDASGDHDAHGTDHDHTHEQHGGAGSWFLSVLTFRSIVAALTFFGLVGLTASRNLKHEAPISLALAVAAGLAALFLVAYLMRMLHRLKSDGTVHIERAVGRSGTVYLTIPGQKAGMGKVTLSLQNRLVEYQAVTPHPQLPTGAKIVVTAILGPDTVEVAPAPESGSLTHA